VTFYAMIGEEEPTMNHWTLPPWVSGCSYKFWN